MGLAIAFSLEERQLALPLAIVDQVIRAVAVVPVPKAPDTVQGVIDFHGVIVPVMDARRRLGLQSRASNVSDQFIIVRSSRRYLAFGVDCVLGLMQWDDKDFVPLQNLVSGVDFVDGLIRNEAGLVLVYDPEAFFLPEAVIEDVLDGVAAAGGLHG